MDQLSIDLAHDFAACILVEAVKDLLCCIPDTLPQSYPEKLEVGMRTACS